MKNVLTLTMPRDGYSRAYKEGWNAASAGALAHQNPYPNVTPGGSEDSWWNVAGAFALDVPGQTNWNLWLSGYAEYFKSPFNCEARRRYMVFRVEMVREFITLDAEQDGTRFKYQDGSSIVMDDEHVTVYDRKGEQFIQLRLTNEQDEEGR